MNFYLDSSALAKRYLVEPGTAEVRDLFRRPRDIAVSRLAFAEVASALARRAREGKIELAARDSALAGLPRDFQRLIIVEVRRALVERVAPLVVRHPLRGFDALQLASALTLREESGAVDFWTADDRLATAARAEGLRSTALT